MAEAEFEDFLAHRGYTSRRFSSLSREQQDYLRQAWRMESHAIARTRYLRSRRSAAPDTVEERKSLPARLWQAIWG